MLHRPILIVDDDPDIREALAGLLYEEGYSVRTANNGRDALNVLGQMDRPALILLDLTMPIMDGQSFLSKLREQQSLAKIPVVVVSAVHFRGTTTPEGILTKPIDLNQLLGFIRRYCGPESRVA